MHRRIAVTLGSSLACLVFCAATGCAGGEGECGGVVCASGSQCVDDKCVPEGDGNNDKDGGNQDNDGTAATNDSSSTLDGAILWDVVPPDGGSHEPVVCEELTVPFTETQESFEVPPTARWMHVKAWGGGGNDEGCPGGMGGYTEAVFEVTPGDKLIIIVGAQGHASVPAPDLWRFGFGNHGGGGLSGVFRGPTIITENDGNKAYLIAGGGGSAGYKKDVGCVPGIPGNHPTAGGMSTMQGGPAGDDVNGGGGGYKGGVGGGRGEPGVGGSGYVDPAALDSLLANAEPGQSDPPNIVDLDYNGTAGKTEQNGQIILRFTCTEPVITTPK